jgi:hypothetical protein
MADLRESFPVLEDASTGEGFGLHKSQNGDASAGKVGLTAWVFKDSNGDLVHPQLDAEGRIVVNPGAAGVPKKNRVENAAGSATNVDLASITLTANKSYLNISMIVSCLRESLFQLVQIDDATTTILADILIGPGQYTMSYVPQGLEVVAGSTGIQTLKIQGKNLDKLSALRASLSCIESAV